MKMAYRRKQGISRGSTFEEDFRNPTLLPLDDSSSSSSSSSSLAAKAIRASSAHRDSSLSSVYGQAALSSPTSYTPNASRVSNSAPSTSSPSIKDSTPYEYTSMKNLNESKHGFWGVLARKAKAILEDDNEAQQSASPVRMTLPEDTATRSKYHTPYQSSESRRKTESPTLQKGLGAIASSLNSIGGAIGNAVEGGLTIVENRTAGIIQESRKLHIRKKSSSSEVQNQASNVGGTRQHPLRQSQMQPPAETDQDIQLKASRDVAMAMAAKAKLLLRELKTVKADLAFAKERCAQLEDENKILRENREKGNNLEDDDLIRLQLETLLAEKARLAQENSVYARENRFLREVVEYHQLTMQDVVYLDEGSEEVTEVYPIKTPTGTNLHSVPTSPAPPPYSPPESRHNKNSIPIEEEDLKRHPFP